MNPRTALLRELLREKRKQPLTRARVAAITGRSMSTVNCWCCTTEASMVIPQAMLDLICLTVGRPVPPREKVAA